MATAHATHWRIRTLGMLAALLLLLAFDPSGALGATISGQVTNGSSALPDVCVQGFDAGAQAWTPPVATTATDGAGNYSLTVTAGSYKVQFSDCSATPSRVTEWWNDKGDWSQANVVDVTAGDATNVNAVLAPGHTISGRVTSNGVNGIEHVCVWAQVSQMSYGVGNTETNSNGDYTTQPIAYGVYRVYFSDCNPVTVFVGEWWNNKTDFASADPVDVTITNASAVNAVLATGRTITGRVTSDGVNGIEGICVTPFVTGPQPMPAGFGAQTDANGDYRTAPVSPGQYKLQFQDCRGSPSYVAEWWNNKPDWSAGDAIDLSVSDATNVNAQLATGRTISGRVTSNGTDGVQGICVAPFSPTSQTPLGWGTQTQADGSYTTNPLTPGQYKLQFTDCRQSPSFVTEWWNNKGDWSNADPIDISTANATGKDVVLVQGRTVSGRVTSNGTDGIQGICVSAHSATAPGPWTPQVGFGNTNDTGNYTMVLPSGQYKVMFNDCRPSPVYISEWWNDKPSSQTADVVDVSSSNATNVNAVMAAGRTISGKVTSDGITGIPNICLNVSNAAGPQGTPGFAGSTRNDGTYTTNPLPPGQYRLQFSDCRPSPQYLAEWWNDKSSFELANTIDLSSANAVGRDAELALGHTISGRVTSDGVNGIQSVIVVAYPDGSPGWPQEFPPYMTNTAPDGTYRLGPMPLGSFHVGFGGGVRYFNEWYDDVQNIGAGTLVNTATDPTGIDAVLEAGRTISGRVTSNGTTGIQNVCVGVVDANNDELWYGGGSTDADGNYTAGPLRDGSYKIEFRDCNEPATYVSEWWNDKTGWPVADAVTVSGADVTGKDAVLATGHTISGRVTSNGTTGIANVCAGVADASGEDIWFGGTGTDQDGYFTTQPLANGSYKLHFEDCNDDQTYIQEWWNDKSDWQSADAIAVTGANVTGKNAVLAVGHKISGRVTSNGTTGIEGVCVNVTDAGDENAWRAGTGTNVDGYYTTEPLPDGSYKVEFEDCTGSPTYVREWWNDKPGWQAADPIVLSGADATGRNAVLAVGHTISGRVTSNGTTGIPYLCVNVYDANNEEVGFGSTQTGDEGYYTTEALPDGSYKLEFYDCGESPTWVTEWWNDKPGWWAADAITVAGTNVTGKNAVLTPGHTVSGRVTSNGTTGIGNVCVGVVSATDEEGWVGGADTDSAGYYRTEPVAYGHYKVNFSDCNDPTLYVTEWWNDKSDWASATPVNLTSVNATNVNATLALGGGVTGTVRSGSGGGPLLSGICVEARGTDVGSIGWGWSGSDGTYRAGGLKTGHYTLTFTDCREDQTGGTYPPQVIENVYVVAPSDTLGVNVNMGSPDNTTPDTFISSGPSGTTDRTSAAFTFDSDEPGVQYQCRLDGGAWQNCATPYGLSGLAEGSHTLQVRARDAVAHQDASPASRTWTVDTSPPLSSHTATGSLPAGGGTVSDDPLETGASSTVPVTTAVTAPGAGSVTITLQPTSGSPPGGWAFFGQQVLISSTVASNPNDPLEIVFTIDSSLVGGTALGDVDVFRNGSPAGNCGSPSVADPDPCVVSRVLLTGGDVRLTVLSSSASTWNFGAESAMVPPSAPGKPVATPGITSGNPSLSWPASTNATGYVLEFKDLDSSWAQVATGIATASYSYPGTAPEGTLVYRVKAVGPGGESTWSATSSPVIVDRTPPAAPRVSTDRSPFGDWYRDAVVVSFTAGADPGPDGSGSGVDPATVPAPKTFASTGSHTATGTVRDLAGNTSAAASITLKVDADAPLVSIACPTSVGQGAVAAAHWTATDLGSGLVTPAAGDVVLDTAAAGAHTAVAPTAGDSVGHTAAGVSCSYTVTPTAPPATPTAKIVTTAVRATSKGVVSIRVRCTGAACGGTLTLKAKIARKTVTLGSKRFTIPAGTTKTLAIKLSRTNLAKLKKAGKVRATATVRLTTGGTTATATIVVRAPRR